MRYAEGRPAGRLCCWAIVIAAVTCSVGLGTAWASPVPQSGPATTTVTEVRTNDFGWGQANDRNLLGRFTTQTFTLPRVARTQNYFLRLHNSASPPQYSGFSAALHVDSPL
jgi:hypothetical protein